MKRPTAPSPNFETQAYWDGCKQGQLLLQKCSVCGVFRHPPAPICPECLSPKSEWVESSGHGTIYTYIIVHETRARGWDQLVPYVTAVVILDEGPRILTNIIDIAPEEVKIDMPVAVTFAEAEGEDAAKLPLFRPVR